MAELTIKTVDHLNDKEIIVGFSDGSTATFTVKELAELHRFRIVPKEDTLHSYLVALDKVAEHMPIWIRKLRSRARYAIRARD